MNFSNFYFNLLVWRHSTKYNFWEPLRWEHVKADAANYSIVFDQDKAFVFSVKI